MKQRFMLTAAGAAATGFAGAAANAELVDMVHGMDRWAGEHAWQVISSGGSTVASMFVSGGQLYYSGVNSLSLVANSASSAFGTVYGTLDLAAGTYNVQMQDTYGDGWAWDSYAGFLSIGSGSGTVSSASASFNFTVVPAPGALALLGLAGLAGTRRRK
tara:strand:- start:211 stop:687 length:477 start_codon:yes stop_codon:yes gene_type:complete